MRNFIAKQYYISQPSLQCFLYKTVVENKHLYYIPKTA